MRYVSPYSELKLLRRNGTIAHRFYNGVLVIGDKTTRNGTNTSSDSKAYTIDSAAYASAPTTEVMLVKTDLQGRALGDVSFNRIQAIGLGSLSGLDYDLSTPLTTIPHGYQGTFYEAPELGYSGTTLVVDAWYEVLSGTVTYNSVVYKTGETFKVVTGTTSFTGTGKIALSVTPLVSKIADLTKEYFKIQHLEVGDESTDYWKGEEGGFAARSDMGTLDNNFTGWSR